MPSPACRICPLRFSAHLSGLTPAPGGALGSVLEQYTRLLQLVPDAVGFRPVAVLAGLHAQPDQRLDLLVAEPL